LVIHQHWHSSFVVRRRFVPEELVRGVPYSIATAFDVVCGRSLGDARIAVGGRIYGGDAQHIAWQAVGRLLVACPWSLVILLPIRANCVLAVPGGALELHSPAMEGAWRTYRDA